MEISPIRTHQTTDIVYDSFTEEYSRYIEDDIDREFTDLVNNVDDYLKKRNVDMSGIIENLKKLINSIGILDVKCRKSYIDFNDNPETNLRLSFLLPKIVRIRQNAYKKAYYIASEIIEGKIPSNMAIEDFNLAREIIDHNPIANFYADLTVYLSTDNLARFANECLLLDLVSDILEGKEIPANALIDLEERLNGSHKYLFGNLKHRFIPRGLHIVKNDANINN